MSRPTVQELHQQLKDLVNWERLAIHLPKITQTDIEIIKRENPNNVISQKQTLFGKWLQLYPNASWDAVVLALEVVDENCLAKQISDQCLSKSQEPAKQQLCSLERWDEFVVNLPIITGEDIEESQDINQAKLHFEKWQDSHPNDSNFEMITAAKSNQQFKVPEFVVREDIVSKLNELYGTFTSLFFRCTKAFKELVESGEVPLRDLVVLYTRLAETAYVLDELNYVNTANHYFQIINQHCNFLDYHLLVNLVERFLTHSELHVQLQEYAHQAKEFIKSTKVRQLHQTLTPFTTKYPQKVPVIIRVQNTWEEHELKLVEALLKTLFHLEDKDILNLFRVIPG